LRRLHLLQRERQSGSRQDRRGLASEHERLTIFPKVPLRGDLAQSGAPIGVGSG